MEPSKDSNKHANSTGTQALSSTKETNYIKNVLKSISLALHVHLLEVLNIFISYPYLSVPKDQKIAKDTSLSVDAAYFDEEKYIKDKSEPISEEGLAQLKELPNVEHICGFITSLHDCVQVRPETLVVSLIYIKRIIAAAGVHLTATNWRPLVLCALLVAYKVCDETPISNDKAAFIYPFFTVKEIDALEQKFLELIQYQVNVKAKIYAKYYFEIERLLSEGKTESPLSPLDQIAATRLEIRSEALKVEIEKAEKEGKLNSNYQELHAKTGTRDE